MYNINGVNYELIENSRNGFNLDDVKELFTDFFEKYDYLVGDWSYGKLRLKGFNDKSNKSFNKINDFSMVKDYIENYCAYGCKYFILKKVLVDKK